MAEKKVTLGYWEGYGKAQPARYLLELTKTPYNDVKYVEDDDWFKRDKYNLGLQFPNLPYLIDGDFSLTEFIAIFDYLVDTYGKAEWKGKGKDQYVVSTLRSLLDELSGSIYYYGLKPTEEEKKSHYESTILPKFKQLQKFIGNKEYLLGYFTIADLYFLSVIKCGKSSLPNGLYSEFASTFDPLIDRLSSIPEIQSYIASDRHPK